MTGFSECIYNRSLRFFKRGWGCEDRNNPNHLKDTWKYSFEAWNLRFLPNRHPALHMPRTKKISPTKGPDKIGGSVRLEFQTNNDCVLIKHDPNIT